MKLDEIFDPADALDDVEARSKRQVLRKIAAILADNHNLDEKTVFDILHERERLGSTAVGGGAAIPHAKVPGLNTLVGCVARLAEPVDFDAHDDRPVDLVVALLAPDTGGAEHLRVLARLSRALRDPEQRDALRACADKSALRDTLAAQPPQRATAA